MYGYIQGKFTYKTPTYVYLDVQGLAYHVNISLNTYTQIEQLAEGKLFTHLVVKEDDLSLYGFASESERQLFVLLLSVSGVGANTARVILSYMQVDELSKAIMNDDAVTLGKVKGIGPKTAKKIAIDLKDKVMKLTGLEAYNTPSTPQGGIKEDALSALVALGFAKPIVDRTINSVCNANPQITQVEELIKLVLKQMN